jgi:hypothetical protein
MNGSKTFIHIAVLVIAQEVKPRYEKRLKQEADRRSRYKSVNTLHPQKASETTIKNPVG